MADPFRSYRQTLSLPSKFQYGMCCFLDRIAEMEGEEVAQKTYRELKAVPDSCIIDSNGTSWDLPGIPILFSLTDLSFGITALHKAVANMGLEPLVYGFAPEEAFAVIENYPRRFYIVFDSHVGGSNHTVLAYKTRKDGKIVIDQNGQAVFPSELVSHANTSKGKVVMFIIDRKNESFRKSRFVSTELSPDELKKIGPFWVSDEKLDEIDKVAISAIDDFIKIGKPAPLIEALGDENEGIRVGAAVALAKMGEPAVSPLIVALGDENIRVVARAVMVLGVIGEPAVSPLIAALRDENEKVHMRAIIALCKIGEPAVKPLRDLLNDKNEDIQQRAALCLKKIGNA